MEFALALHSVGVGSLSDDGSVTQSRRLGMLGAGSFGQVADRLAVGMGGDYVGSNWFGSPQRRSVDHTFTAGAFTETGGARAGWWRATYPLARLTVDNEWVRIRLALQHPVWIGRGEVWQVRRSSGGRFSGVLFDSRDGRFDSVAWYSFAPDAVLSALAQHGWPIAPPPGPSYLHPPV